MLFSVSPSFDANMPWRNTITRWLSDKCIMQDGNLATLELIKLLIEENTIPSTLVNNPTLHSIILTQVLLETLTGITVPQVSQGRDLTYRMDAKEMMMLDSVKFVVESIVYCTDSSSEVFTTAKNWQ